DILDQMRATIPEEIKQARWIVKERQEMLAEAKREAERIVKEARERAERLVSEEEITKQAERAAEDIIEDARAREREIRLGAADTEAGGPSWDVLAGHETDPLGSVPALRFMAAVHRLVLRGEAPDLARHYPSAGGRADAGDPWPDFRAALAEHADALRELIELPVQTNEVGRSAALLGGFLEVGRSTALPLAIFEIGSSAGLNLHWDRWFYDAGAAGTWGDRRSPVRL